MAEGKDADWRELCAAAAQEQDATKLAALVNRLIRAIDETRARPHASHPRADAALIKR